MRFLSVFAGIGGFDLGLERANWECGGQCEIDPYCTAVLRKHWPKVWRWNDVKTLSGELIHANCGHLDALVAAPPCQPSSFAGERRGAADDRWLWPDYLRLVSEINDAQERPLLFLLAENPRGVTSIRVEGLQFGEWLARELKARGYELLPVKLAAEDVGAPHRRERVWFVARLANARRPQRRTAAERRIDEPDWADTGREEEAGRPVLRSEELAHTDWPARPGELQHEWEEPRVIAAQSGLGSATHGISSRLAGRRRVAALKALGNAVVPVCGEAIGKAILEAEWKMLN